MHEIIVDTIGSIIVALEQADLEQRLHLIVGGVELVEHVVLAHHAVVEFVGAVGDGDGVHADCARADAA
ncbi:MAG: hypothetical protein ACLTGO_11395 [Bifidobacterium scardovii]